jgi:hypothetical protein
MDQLLEFEDGGVDCTQHHQEVCIERRRTSAAEVLYGVAAMTVAIFLLATTL